MVTEERNAAEGMGADGGDEGASALTGVAAELFAPDGDEASARDARENGTGADEDGSEPDPVAVWIESDEGQRTIRKLADKYNKNDFRTLRKALDGDEKARDTVQKNSEMRRTLARIEQQRSTDVVQEVDALSRGQTEWERLTNLSAWELKNEFDNAPVERLPNGTVRTLASWYYNEWPQVMRRQQEKRQSPGTRTAVASDAESALEEAYETLLEDDDAEALTDDERALFSPEKYADMSPTKALAAMNRDARKAFAQAEKRVQSTPYRARSAAINRATAAVAAGAAKSPPNVGGTAPPRGQTFEQIRDETREKRRNGTLTAQDQAKYDAAAKRQFGR